MRRVYLLSPALAWHIDGERLHHDLAVNHVKRICPQRRNIAQVLDYVRVFALNVLAPQIERVRSSLA